MANNQNQGPFSFMPLPFNPFPFIQQPSIPQQPVTHGPPPARVRVALEFLMDLTVKGMTRAAANDLAIELIPGQQLSHDEKEAQKAACACLKEYFAGKTKPDAYEKIAERKFEKKTLADGKPGLVLTCIGCGGQIPKMYNCTICKGAGEIMVFPTTKNNSDEGDD